MTQQISQSIDYHNPWIYKNKIITSEDIKPYFGFVYLITNLSNNSMYIGRKYFWIKKKVKDSIRRKTVESNWKRYYSSHEGIKEISKTNPDILKREILHLCRSQGETNFLEIEEQFKRDVLYLDIYLNDQINGKWYKKNVQYRYRRNE
jgi:hypothetical protein